MISPPKKNSPAKQVIQAVCAAIGLAVALGAMFAMGISGALPGALFGHSAPGAGSVIGWAIAAALIHEP